MSTVGTPRQQTGGHDAAFLPDVLLHTLAFPQPLMPDGVPWESQSSMELRLKEEEEEEKINVKQETNIRVKSEEENPEEEVLQLCWRQTVEELKVEPSEDLNQTEAEENNAGRKPDLNVSHEPTDSSETDNSSDDDDGGDQAPLWKPNVPSISDSLASSTKPRDSSLCDFQNNQRDPQLLETNTSRLSTVGAPSRQTALELKVLLHRLVFPHPLMPDGVPWESQSSMELHVKEEEEKLDIKPETNISVKSEEENPEDLQFHCKQTVENLKVEPSEDQIQTEAEENNAGGKPDLNDTRVPTDSSETEDSSNDGDDDEEEEPSSEPKVKPNWSLLKKTVTVFNCDFCTKMYASKKSREVHMRIHTEKKPFSCDVCSKRYPFKHQLKSHMRIHTGEKPYTCDVCSKKFVTSGLLKVHKRLHIGEKPVGCDNKGFPHKVHVKRHKR